MATGPVSGLNQASFEVPEPPTEFGQDGGRFYRLYDNLAAEIDEDMTQELKEQLDGLLVFAGLFAGVNSAFLALTLPLLTADHTDDTNALLAQNNAILLQLMQGQNDTSLSNFTLPSTTFAPSPGIFTVNILFSFSLALAIVSSFLAVLGRQWLVYYRKRSGGGPDRQRWEELKRFLGAERWRLELVLDDILPSLLLIGLIIFCISLVLYLDVLNPTISHLVGIPLGLGLAMVVLSAFFTVWDRFCPFHSPLAHFLGWVGKYLIMWLAQIWQLTRRFGQKLLILRILQIWWYPFGRLSRSVRFQFARIWPKVEKVWTEHLWPKIVPIVPILLGGLGLLASYVAIILIPLWLPWVALAYLADVHASSIPQDIANLISRCFEEVRSGRFQVKARNSIVRLFQSLFRGYFSISTDRASKNEVAFLQVVAVKRTICTSDETFTLLCATANLFTVNEAGYLEGLWSDEMFHSRLIELCTNPYQRMVELLGQGRIEAAVSAARLYRGALCHIFLSINFPDEQLSLLHGDVPEDICKAIMSEPLVDANWLVPPERVEKFSPVLIETALASWMLRACVEYVPMERIGAHISEYSESLNLSSWKLLSLIVYILTKFPRSIEFSLNHTKRPLTSDLPGAPVRDSFPHQATSTHPGTQEANMSSPIRPSSTVIPESTLGMQPALVGQHIPVPCLPEQIATGQPILFEPDHSRSGSDPVRETSLTAREAPFDDLLPVLNLGELRFAYTRDVGKTLKALERVALALARNLYKGDLDCHRILLNILRCVREVTSNDSRYPNTKIEDKIGLLEVAEQVLRIEGIPVQVRATATMLRLDCVSMLRRRFLTGELRRKIPSGLLVLLGNFFFKLRSRSGSSQLSNEEDMATLYSFGPLLRELYTSPTTLWKMDDMPFEDSSLKNLCDEVRQVHVQFGDKVDRTFRMLQHRESRYNRDPEISWCHRKEILDLDLPAQQFPERTTFPTLNLSGRSDSDLGQDSLYPIWRHGLASPPPSPVEQAQALDIISSPVVRRQGSIVASRACNVVAAAE
ncbi:hypothetical protein FS837_004505 [Tulasnella sp. UAMH 9824]|nr:hypothetical protein FS837_004505 [Tulasnella sp. UAMH 9824]